MAIMSYYLSEEEFQENFREELEKLLHMFLEKHPDQSDARLLAADFFLDTNNYKAAYEQLKVYLESHAGNYTLYMQAILLANAASMNDELIRISDQALEEFPDSMDIRFFKAIGLYENEAYEDLVEHLEHTYFDQYSVDEYASQSRLMFAEAYYRLKNYPLSDSLFEQMIEEEPDNYIVLNNYSYYLAERGEKLEQALKWSFLTIKNNPENATFLDTYAWILYKMNKLEEAEKYILTALKKGGENDPEVNEHAGDIQVALESYEIAKSYYRKAIILGGNSTLLEQKIESLQSSQHE
jgi:tetratricopeptide (TPR) repeat protein